VCESLLEAMISAGGTVWWAAEPVSSYFALARPIISQKRQELRNNRSAPPAEPYDSKAARLVYSKSRICIALPLPPTCLLSSPESFPCSALIAERRFAHCSLFYVLCKNTSHSESLNCDTPLTLCDVGRFMLGIGHEQLLVGLSSFDDIAVKT
jgi:hypothetical protein